MEQKEARPTGKSAGLLRNAVYTVPYLKAAFGEVYLKARRARGTPGF
jgi:hypothetical protein